MYQISESELTTLEQKLDQLKKNSESKQHLLTEQKKQLEKAREQLNESKRLNSQMQDSLSKANQSLKTLEKEAQKKIKTKARQRNLWIVISGGILYCLINK